MTIRIINPYDRLVVNPYDYTDELYELTISMVGVASSFHVAMFFCTSNQPNWLVGTALLEPNRLNVGAVLYLTP